MTQIELDDATAAKLTAEATKAGLTVDAYVQTVLLGTDSMKIGVATKEPRGQTNTGARALLGAWQSSPTNSTRRLSMRWRCVNGNACEISKNDAGASR